MKAFGKIFIVLGIIIGMSAQAIHNPHWERPILEADLTERFGHEAFRFPVPESMTLHQRDGVKQPTLISIVENAGFVCVQGPCPSLDTALFAVTSVKRVDPLTVKYTAEELPKATEQGIFNGLRKLEVVDFAGFQQQWNVTLKDSQGVRHFIGYPKGIATIESLDAE